MNKPIQAQSELRQSKTDVLYNRGLYFSNEQLIDLTVILWFCNAPLKSLINIPLSILGIAGLTMAVAGIVTYIPLYLYFLLEKRIPCKRFVCVYSVIALFFIATLSVHPEYEYWYNREIYGVAYTIFRPDHGALWAVLMVEMCGSYKRLFRNIKIVAAIVFIHNLYLAYSAEAVGYWTFFSESGEVARRNYDLDFGYNMAFVSIVALIVVIREKKVGFWAVVCCCVVLDLRFGSRGSLLCIAVAGVLLTVFSDGSIQKKLFTTSLLIVISVLLLTNIEFILLSIADVLHNTLGINSRTVTSLLQGELFDDNGRDGIYAIAQNALSSNPNGYGAYGDRAIIGPFYYWGYSHSIVYEMALNFGVVGAAVILAGICFLAAICLFKTRSSDCRSATILSVSMCMRLVVSDTFWGNNFFWMLIGILLLYFWKSSSSKDRVGV